MLLERVLVAVYLLGCIGIGIAASRKVLGSRDEYWVVGRRIGTTINSMAIMAALASGGSIIGVMGLAYSQGIPATLALFAGAVLGFPIASLLVARPLRNFGKYTITDFLAYRYPSAVVRYLVPTLIVIAFTIYIVAQLKAAGITATALLGIPYNTALTLATLVFIIYVSFGGMIAITWTDVIQGFLMLVVVVGAALVLMWRVGSPFEIMARATAVAPELGQVVNQPVASYLGYFVIWATAIPVIPHIVMRVFTAKDAASAGCRSTSPCSPTASSFGGGPGGRAGRPHRLSGPRRRRPVVPAGHGVAIPAARPWHRRGCCFGGGDVDDRRAAPRLQLGDCPRHPRWIPAWSRRRKDADPCENRVDLDHRHTGAVLGFFAAGADQPVLTAGIGLLSSSLFVPTIAGLWWKRANRVGGVAALVAGSVVYMLAQFDVIDVGVAPLFVALLASATAMIIGGVFGSPETPEMLAEIEALHA